MYNAIKTNDMITKYDFKEDSNILDIFKSKSHSDIKDIRTGFSANRVNGGVELKYDATFENLKESRCVRCSFYFPDYNEERNYSHIVSNEEPTAISKFVFPLFEEVKTYFNVAIFDEDGLMILAESIVFDNNGNITHIQKVHKMMGHLNLKKAWVEEVKVVDEYRKYEDEKISNYKIRFYNEFENVSSKTTIKHVLQNTSFKVEKELEVNEDNNVVYSEFSIDDIVLSKGFWMIVSIDDKNNLIAQSTINIG